MPVKIFLSKSTDDGDSQEHHREALRGIHRWHTKFGGRAVLAGPLPRFVRDCDGDATANEDDLRNMLDRKR